MNNLMRKNGTRYLTALLIGSILTSSGCSVVGLGVGAVIDSCTPDYKQVEIDRVKSIKQRTKTVVYLDNGSLRTGKFERLETRRAPENPYSSVDSGAVSIEETLVLQINGIPDSLARSGISGERSREYINLNDIKSVEVRRTKYCKWIGLAVGLAIDFYNIGKVFSNMNFEISMEGFEF